MFLLVGAHVLWWAERGGGAISKAYFPGIFEAFWCVFATMTTVGYGDIAPKRWLGRIMAVCIMFSGITLFGIFAAALTADLVTEKRLSAISSVEDLRGMDIGVKRNTTSSRFLKKQGLLCKEAESFEKACQLLAEGTVARGIRRTRDPLSGQKESRVHRGGRPFHSEYYAFGFPEDSSLIESVDRAIPRG